MDAQRCNRTKYRNRGKEVCDVSFASQSSAKYLKQTEGLENMMPMVEKGKLYNR